MGQPSGGQVQLQVNAQATSILQSQSQHHQVPPVQAANILEASDNFLLDNTATSAIAVQTAGWAWNIPIIPHIMHHIGSEDMVYSHTHQFAFFFLIYSKD